MSRTAESSGERISTWSDLADLIDHFSYFSYYDWVFRGVTDIKYKLQPKIGRKDTRKLKLKPRKVERQRVPYRQMDEVAVLEMFRQQARPYLKSPPDRELEWLAIAQHFGLPTRLLDWTDSLLVAAWFAVQASGTKSADSAIWITKGVPFEPLGSTADPFLFSKPTVYRPPHIDPRISAQGSVLMICPRPTEEIDLLFSRKIKIDRDAKFTIRKRLNACGINGRHLFPTLEGLTSHLSWMYENDWLSGYRDERFLEKTNITLEREPGDQVE